MLNNQVPCEEWELKYYLSLCGLNRARALNLRFLGLNEIDAFQYWGKMNFRQSNNKVQRLYKCRKGSLHLTFKNKFVVNHLSWLIVCHFSHQTSYYVYM